MSKILVVEDEEEILSALKSIIELSEKHLVLTANDGRNGYRIFCKESFDLIITDLNMPGGNGLWLAKEIRKINNEIPILFMTGFDSPSLIELNTIGSSHVLRKPEDIPFVLSVIEKILEN